MPPRVSAAAVLLAFSLTACVRPLGASTLPTVPPQQAADATLAAMLGTQQASQATAPPAPTTTETAPPSATLPSATATSPSPTPTVPCTDRAGFVKDVTVPDGTLFRAGATFTKTWRLKNTGTCTWTTGYALVFFSGDQMNAPAMIALASEVPPGATIDLSAGMDAPASSGYYEGNWRLRNAAGALFGTGAGGKGYFWVKIRVGAPSKTATPPR